MHISKTNRTVIVVATLAMFLLNTASIGVNATNSGNTPISSQAHEITSYSKII
ncbi:MAG: hypothetical protein OK457_07460 [Thaumarchaeota archaeon]|nr:hypothetical protein [Nitrososphaerota archaeon]